MKLIAVFRCRLPQSTSSVGFSHSEIIGRHHQHRRRLWRAPSTHFSAPYSSSVSSTLSKNGKQEGHEKSIAVPVQTMSSRGFYRRNTRSDTAALNPTATNFEPVPPPAWQPVQGQMHHSGNHGHAGFGQGYQPQGMLGNHPVFHQQGQHPLPTPGGSQMPASSGIEARPVAQPDNPDFDPDVDSDTSSDPSVGEPLPQLTTDQVKTVTIPTIGKSAKKKATLKEKKRPYLVPSKASGGVPNPSPSYRAQAAIAPSRLDVPHNVLVIIDLNGTILHRPSHKHTKRFVERPFARNFLDYCLRTFTVGIWSSAKPDNVRGMVAQLLSPKEQNKLVTIWGRDTLGLSAADYNQRVQVYKRLESVWNDPKVVASHPEAHYGKRWDQTNTVLIDDSMEKARSQPFNLIQLPEFEGDVTEPGYVLPQVHDYLNECAHQRDISSFIRENPFRFDPMFDLQPKGAALATVNPTTANR